MNMENILQLIANYGVTIVIVAYFVYKDNKFSVSLERTLQELKDTIKALKETVERDTDET